MENHEQKKVVLYLTDLEIQKKIVTFFAVENENPFSKHLRKEVIFKLEQNAKAMGKKPGVSDIVIIGYNKVYFLEMKDKPKILKSGKKSVSHTKTSDEQKKFLQKVKSSSACESIICYGYDEAAFFIDNVILKD